MGAVLGSQMRETMEENFKKNQEFMLATQKMQLGRQMAMQQLMQQRMMAVQLARQREMFNWVAAFTGTTSVVLLLGFMRKKNPAALAPLLPLGFITAYQYDAVYGDKMTRIRADAEYILDEQSNMVEFPRGKLKLEDVEKFRNQ
ncbi:plasminogen receptor (KT)-like [Hydractinia symbiolongicarpus]|uniref:plasminogen receptor (KT)-like n=1 Tax=Hydractinia symbiolongicarpus TaxID=13093 RepID=UPI0025516496|nr:plasminogen receptor (KT)-like [Hydractinia symbiolongicarpus]